MATIVSKQAARIATGKAYPQDMAKKRTIVITSPDTVTWADGDIVPSGMRLPTGTRFLCDNYVSSEAMGAGVLVDVGIRDWDTKVAIDAQGIGSGVDVSAAARTITNNGNFVKGGIEYVTTVPTELYYTVRAAVATANRQCRVEVNCLLPG